MKVFLKYLFLILNGITSLIIGLVVFAYYQYLKFKYRHEVLLTTDEEEKIKYIKEAYLNFLSFKFEKKYFNNFCDKL